MAAARYVGSAQQEQRSRAQLKDRFAEVGWVPADPDQDLGEDFIVTIYTEGRSEGAAFYVQLKSVTDLLARRRGAFLVYDCSVADLKHWEDFALPVVFFVWDVNLGEGRWGIIGEIISGLDSTRPSWRDNKRKARIRIPWGNTSDDSGFSALRSAIGLSEYTLISKGRPVEGKIVFRFPKTPDGAAAKDALMKHIKFGEEATVPGEFVSSFDVSEWWSKWFVPKDMSLASFSLGRAQSSTTTVVNIDFIGEEDTVSFPNIELRAVQVGTDELQLSNHHRSTSVHFHFILPRPSIHSAGQVKVKFQRPAKNVLEARRWLRVQTALARGGKLTVTMMDGHGKPLVMQMPPAQVPEPDYREVRLVERLCRIQAATGIVLRFPDRDLSGEDARAAEDLSAIMLRGKASVRGGSFVVRADAPDQAFVHQLKTDEKCWARTAHEESWLDLFDQRVPVGPRIRYVSGVLDSSDQMQQELADWVPGQALTLRLVETEVTELFPDWFNREARKLARELARDPCVKKVYLYGELVWSDFVPVDTKIQLAIVGLDADALRAANHDMNLKTEYAFDLVDLEAMPEPLRTRVVTEGRRCYPDL